MYAPQAAKRKCAFVARRIQTTGRSCAARAKDTSPSLEIIYILAQPAGKIKHTRGIFSVFPKKKTQQSCWAAASIVRPTALLCFFMLRGGANRPLQRPSVMYPACVRQQKHTFVALQQQVHALEQLLVLGARFHNIDARRLDAGVAEQVRQLREIFFTP